MCLLIVYPMTDLVIGTIVGLVCIGVLSACLRYDSKSQIWYSVSRAFTPIFLPINYLGIDY